MDKEHLTTQKTLSPALPMNDPNVGNVLSALDGASGASGLGSGALEVEPEVPSESLVKPQKVKRKRTKRPPKPLSVGEVLSMLFTAKYRDALKAGAAQVRREVDEKEKRAKLEKERSKPKRRRGAKRKTTSHSKPKRKRHH